MGLLGTEETLVKYYSAFVDGTQYSPDTLGLQGLTFGVVDGAFSNLSWMALNFLSCVGTALIQASGKGSIILLTCRWWKRLVALSTGYSVSNLLWLPPYLYG